MAIASHARRRRGGDRGAHIVLVEGDQHVAGGVDPLADLIAQSRVDQRLMACLKNRL